MDPIDISSTRHYLSYCRTKLTKLNPKTITTRALNALVVFSLLMTPFGFMVRPGLAASGRTYRTKEVFSEHWLSNFSDPGRNNSATAKESQEQTTTPIHPIETPTPIGSINEVESSPTATQPPTSSPTLTPTPITTPAEFQAPLPELIQNLSALPLSIVPNRGQVDSSVLFHVHSLGGERLFFTSDGVTLLLHTLFDDGISPGGEEESAQGALIVPSDEGYSQKELRLNFVSSNPNPRVRADDQLPGTVNYFLGDNPANWATDLPIYGTLVYEDLYPGIDLHYEGSQGILKGTLIVSPGIDPGQIQWRYENASSININNKSGNALIETTATRCLSASGDLICQDIAIGLVENAPLAWQELDGRKVQVETSYRLSSDGILGFQVGHYNPRYPLVLDPTLSYSTYLGGSGYDAGFDVGTDDEGNLYLVGRTLSINFPTENPIQGSRSGMDDAFITKLSPDGSTLIYSTYLGGTDGTGEAALGVAVEGGGAAYMTGLTDATDFPLLNPAQASPGGDHDAFVSKLNPDGTLSYSTYLGGSGQEGGGTKPIRKKLNIAVDSSGSSYVAGVTDSTDFPLYNPYQSSLAGGTDAFLTRLSPDGSSFTFSTYLGGAADDHATNLGVDGSGDVSLVGTTTSTDFPTANALQPDCGGTSCEDAFLTKIDPAGPALVFSTYLGGSDRDEALGIHVDSGGEILLGGYTVSTDFPVLNAWQESRAGGKDGFIAKVAADGSSLIFSTYLGGTRGEDVYELDVDAGGFIHAVGKVKSVDFPTLDPVQSTHGGLLDAFAVRLTSDGIVTFSTYLGGSHMDEAWGVVADSESSTVLGGFTYSDDFPVVDPFQGARGGSMDAFLSVIDHDTGTPTPTPTETPEPTPEIPPDPEEVAPDLDQTVTTNMHSAVSFIFTGLDPIQTGMDPETISPTRVAVLRGRVLDSDGQPMAGVTISVLDHPEYGQTVSRLDGVFDLVVNGGGRFMLVYSRSGFLTVQRQVIVPWRDYVWLADVVLQQIDSNVTEIELSTLIETTSAQGSPIQDEDGSRRAVAVFEPGLIAELEYDDGSKEPIDILNVHLTEYTVGENGISAMPGELPPNVAYTYALELSVEEAMDAGAEWVSFNQPIPIYVENFLGFPAGTSVPLGYYDLGRGVWVPSDSGIVLTLVDTDANGLALLDIDGDDLPDDVSALGISDAEREYLPSLYENMQSLWRMPIPHFSAWDANWAFGPPGDAITANGGPPDPNALEDDPCQQSGSIIECQNQVLGQAVGITGANFRLHYQSDRVIGRDAALDIPLSGASVPASLESIELEIFIAGRHFSESFGPGPNIVHRFVWDGLDAYGRQLQGLQPVTVRIGYTYDGVYQDVPRFGYNGDGIPITGSQTRRDVTLWQEWETEIGYVDQRGLGLGGWSLSAHHFYDPNTGILFFGDGSRRSAQSINLLAIDTIAGTGAPGFPNDGGLAVEESIQYPLDVEVGSDGTIYFTHLGGITRIEPDGRIYSHASDPLEIPWAVDAAPDGSLYVADWGLDQVLRVAVDGTIEVIAGTGVPGFSGDGGPASDAQLGNPFDVVLGLDGSLYIADTGNNRIRRIDTAGIISTFAESGADNLALGPDGAIYTFGGDDNEMADDGTRYATFSFGQRIYRVDPYGVHSWIAGDTTDCSPSTDPCGDGGPATRAQIQSPVGIAIGQEGELYVADWEAHRIRLVQSYMPGFGAGDYAIPSKDGTLLYQFDGFGRHLQTIHTLTGATLLTFDYDMEGRLIQVSDGDDNVTTLERDAAGNLTALIAPFGQRTELDQDQNGYISSITNPANESVSLTYDSLGLMTELRDPADNPYTYEFDTAGRLEREQDPAGGYKALDRSSTSDGYVVNLTTSEGIMTSYQIGQDLPEAQTRTNTFRDGTQTITDIQPDASRTTLLPGGTTADMQPAPDPRFGMQAPYAASVAVSTSGGLDADISSERSVTLSEPSNPLSLTEMTNTISVNGRIFSSTYDAATQTYSSTSPEGRSSSTRIDPLGRPVEESVAGLSPVSYSYDTFGRIESLSIGSGAEERTTTYSYYSDGYLERIVDPLGRATRLEYDQAGRIILQELPGGRVLEYDYDLNGNLISLTPPGRPVHTFQYTVVNQTETYNPPDVGPPDQTTYSHDLDGRLTQVARPDSQTLDFVYEPGTGRLQSLSQSIPAVTTTYGYDPVTGQISSIVRSDGLDLAYEYDGGLLTELDMTGQVEGSVAYSYDDNFLLSSISVNGVAAIDYGYDADGLVTNAGDLALNLNTQNGLIEGTTLGSVADAWTYNGFGEPTHYEASSSTEDYYAVDYTYDDLGRILTKAETIQGTAQGFNYGYDDGGRLETVHLDSELVATYTYDANGNRLTESTPAGTLAGVYDDQDRLLEYGETSYFYAPNGELNARIAVDGPTNFSYDLLGNLTDVSLPDGTHIKYLIEGQDRRVGKLVNETLVQGFLYQDGLNPIAELDGAGNVVNRFVYATRVNVPDYIIRGGDTYRIFSDHLGSPRLVIDTATGAVAQRMDYDAWGNVLLDTNPGFQPFGFAGGIYDPDTGLVRFGARDYDPEVGRWTAKDPILFAGGDANLYGYVLADPVNLIDPNGMFLWDMIDILSFAWSLFELIACPTMDSTSPNPPLGLLIFGGILLHGVTILTELGVVRAEVALIPVHSVAPAATVPLGLILAGVGVFVLNLDVAYTSYVYRVSHKPDQRQEFILLPWWGLDE